jgi:hypothetical protein
MKGTEGEEEHGGEGFTTETQRTRSFRNLFWGRSAAH